MRRKTEAELLSLVSHELRTPLSRLRWTAESLQDPALGTLAPAQRAAMASLVRDADELAATVEMLLESATVVLHAGEPARIRFSLPYLVSHVIKEHPAKQHVSVSRRFAPAVPQVSADPKGIETALRLLLSAACASVRKGTLFIRIGAAGGRVRCAISPGADPGPRFLGAFRGRDGRGTMGTSPILASHRLRFYVAQSLIRASGGTLRIDLRADPLAFAFDLPRSAA